VGWFSEVVFGNTTAREDLIVCLGAFFLSGALAWRTLRNRVPSRIPIAAGRRLISISLAILACVAAVMGSELIPAFLRIAART